MQCILLKQHLSRPIEPSSSKSTPSPKQDSYQEVGVEAIEAKYNEAVAIPKGVMKDKEWLSAI